VLASFACKDAVPPPATTDLTENHAETPVTVPAEPVQHPARTDIATSTKEASYAVAGIGIAAYVLGVNSKKQYRSDCVFDGTVTIRRHEESGAWRTDFRMCDNVGESLESRGLVVQQAAHSAIRARVNASHVGTQPVNYGDTIETRASEAFRFAEIQYCADAIVGLNIPPLYELASRVQNLMIRRIS